MTNLHSGQQVRDKLAAGIKKAADAVGATMGTSGSNSLIEMIENPGYIATNDGATILTSIKFDDPIEEMGRKILVEAVSRANKQSGDGSSTTTVLTAAIVEEGRHYLSTVSAMDIKRSLEACIPILTEAITSQTKTITVDDVKWVASISAEDHVIGALIQEIYQQIGSDGIIHWDISKTTEDTYTIGNGITVNGAGYLSSYMCDIDEKTGQFLNQARWSNPHVLIVKQKISSAADFNNLFQKMYNKEIKEVVVFCDEIEATVIPDLIQTRAVRGFKTLVVKMPVLWKDQWYEDLALASGATIIDQNGGVSLKTMDLQHLGKFGHILVSKDDTFIDGVNDLSTHIAKLEEEGTDDSKLRASRLNTKTARIYIGAHSDSALSYKRLKVEDAISAAWQALHGGVVVGGGVAMVNAADSLPDSIGGEILRKALQAPTRRIIANCGVTLDADDLAVSGAKIGGTRGFDTRTLGVVDLLDNNVINPTKVEVNAIKNAISVAATVLTAESLILIPRETLQVNPNMLVR